MAGKSSPSKLKVDEIMVEAVYRVTPDMTLLEVAELFVGKRISGAPVVDQDDRVITVIGEGAILRLAASEGLLATVAHCLPKLTQTEKIVTLHKGASFAEAYKLFIHNNIHRIPIVDSSGHLHGLVSRSQILKMFVEAHYGKKLTA